MTDYKIWEGWEVVGKIGTGGFSTVYKIRKKDEEDNFCSALKIVSIPQNDDEYRIYRGDGYDDAGITAIFKERADRIVSEFKLMRKFRGHTNIVSYEDHMIVPRPEKHGWDVLIRMELLTPLTEYYALHQFGVNETLKLGIDICNALELCEQLNIVHRDIKPQNIFVSDFGSYKLGDFGIARIMDHATRATRVGTPSYIAPEVYNGMPCDHRADIYCLGLVLYWLLNERRLPFVPLPPAVPNATESELANMRRLKGEQLPPPKNGSPALIATVLKACSHDVNGRFTSAAEFKAALMKCLKQSVPPSGGEETLFIPNNSAVNRGNAQEIRGNTYEKAADNSRRKNKTGLILVLVSLLIIISAGAVLGFIMFSDSGNDEESTPVLENSNESADSTVAEGSAFESEEITEEISASKPEAVILHSGTTESKLSWTLDSDGVLTVSGNGVVGNYKENSNKDWFSYKDDIKTIIVEDGITAIGDCAFRRIATAEKLVLGNSIVSIGDNAFSQCDGIKSVVLPEKLGFIDNSAFYSCDSLEKISIPDSVTHIGNSAFSFCSSMKTVEIGSGVSYIGADCFNTAQGPEAINVSEENNSFCSVDGVLFSKDMTVIVHYPAGKSNSSYTIPEGVTEIKDYCFCLNNSLKTVSIPDSVISVGKYAFASSKTLESINIPDSVVSLGDHVFDSSTGIKNITVGRNVAIIGKEAFYACNALENINVDKYNEVYSSVNGVLLNADKTTLLIYPKNKQKSKYSVPETVTRIENNAFEKCETITEIVFSANITDIGDSAFKDCINLHTVYYTFDAEDGKSVSIGKNNDYLVDAKKVFDYNP